MGEPLESGGQIPGLRRRDTQQLQLFHLLQQAGVKADVCRQEIKQVKKGLLKVNWQGEHRGKKKTQENVIPEINLD